MFEKFMVIESEQVAETAKAVQFNLDQTHGQQTPFLVWVPKSCLQYESDGVYSYTLIQKWIVRKNQWDKYKAHNFSAIPSSLMNQ